MKEAEARKIPYLLKLKQTGNVKQLIKQVFSVRSGLGRDKAGPDRPRGWPPFRTSGCHCRSCTRRRMG